MARSTTSAVSTTETANTTVAATRRGIPNEASLRTAGLSTNTTSPAITRYGKMPANRWMTWATAHNRMAAPTKVHATRPQPMIRRPRPPGGISRSRWSRIVSSTIAPAYPSGTRLISKRDDLARADPRVLVRGVRPGGTKPAHPVGRRGHRFPISARMGREQCRRHGGQPRPDHGGDPVRPHPRHRRVGSHPRAHRVLGDVGG